MQILFVCRGNVARSQIASAIFYKLAQGEHSATSAGTEVHNNDGQKLKDKPEAANVINVLREIGIDISDGHRRQLAPEMVAKADKIIAILQQNDVPRCLLELDKCIIWDMPDPFRQPLQFTREVRNQIYQLTVDLLETLK